MKYKKTVIMLLLIAATSSRIAAQSNTDEESSPVETYTPYSPDEFPEWLHQLRRAEIVLVGSFPLTMVFTTLSYEGFRLVRSLFAQSNVVGTMAIEFGNFTANEKTGLLLGGVVLSVAVSVVDLILDRTDSKSRE